MPSQQPPTRNPQTARTAGRCVRQGARTTPWLSPASPLAALLSVRNCPQMSFFCAWRSRNAPAHRRSAGFWVSGGYAPGCARKTGHSRDTRLTRADSWLLAVPVETLPTAFGCVPAHTPRPALQAFARKTAGWRAEWAGVCTKGFRSACVRPV